MNQAISVELKFFLVSIISGAVLLAIYDILRILRRLIKHGSFLIALEDLLFWVGASLFLFAMMFIENDGIIRGFSIMGMAIGMVLYHGVLSELLVNLITKLIRLLFSPFAFVCRKVKAFIVMLIKQGKRIVNFFSGRLKKRTKSVRMALDKRKQKKMQQKKQRAEEKRQAKVKAGKKTANPAENMAANRQAVRPAVTLERVDPDTWKQSNYKK
jgi:spore cortex biosynthesis protein YabQ